MSEQELYDKVVKRINDTPALEQYRDILLYDWPEEDHLEWALNESVAEIVAWCESIRANDKADALEDAVTADWDW